MRNCFSSCLFKAPPPEDPVCSDWSVTHAWDSTANNNWSAVSDKLPDINHTDMWRGVKSLCLVEPDYLKKAQSGSDEDECSVTCWTPQWLQDHTEALLNQQNGPIRRGEQLLMTTCSPGRVTGATETLQRGVKCRTTLTLFFNAPANLKSEVWKRFGFFKKEGHLDRSLAVC